jgi:single-strand selective monofunctional uracil DNA glycosylase
VLKPQWVVGIGGFAEKRINHALKDMHLKTGRITHPSPANPKANQGWALHVETELMAMGIGLPDRKEKGPA